MTNVKYAIRFPDLQSIDYKVSISIFSEASIVETANTFINTFDALGSLTEYVIQKQNRGIIKTIECKRSLDASLDSLKEQKKIQFEEYSKRLQARLQNEKEQMKLEVEKLVLEASSKANEFSYNFEESMRSNQILRSMITTEVDFLNSIKGYIDNLADDCSRRKEYVMYCELQRKSLDLINQYMKEMV